MEFEITVQALKALQDDGASLTLLDVREPHEVEIADIGGLKIPMNELPSELGALNKADHIIVYCRSGRRSAMVVDMLRERGFNRAQNLAGGILAWSHEIDPTVPTY